MRRARLLHFAVTSFFKELQMKFCARFGLAALLFFALSCVAQQLAPDATAPGPLPVAVGQYDLGAQIDNLVLPNCQPRSGYDCKIDIRAEVYRPQTLSGTYPLVLFLHGNHGTCGRPYMSPPDPPGLLGNPRIDDRTDYTGTGKCPTNYIESPSYLGYDYLARRLASYGYIVVSIDANRGITGGPGLGGDSGLIKARGILVMRHLQNLSKWNRHGGNPPQIGVNLQGHLDFTNVGMMGHSRGGDGVRAGYNDYIAQGSIWPGMIEDAVTFKGIFEIAPVDFLGNNSKGVPWNIIAGMCDGDVYDLEGVKPYDRDILPPFESSQTQKSTYIVWGANHDFFNTQWQVSDGTILSPPNFPSICTGAGNTAIFPMSPGSSQQRLTTLSTLLAFFRANVGNATEPDFNRNFNPWWGIPTMVTDENGVMQPYPTRADRGFTPPAPIEVFEDFTMQTGTSSYGFPNLASNITINHGRVPEHDSSLRAGLISWSTSGQNTYFQTNWTAVGSGMDVSSYTTLELRVSRQNNQLNPSSPTDLSVKLMGVSGPSGALQISRYIDPNFAGMSGHQSLLQGPVGSTDELHPILQTVRIPLADFPGFSLVKKNIHGIRLIFDQTSQGAIYVANIRLSNSPVDLVQVQGANANIIQAELGIQPPPVRMRSATITAVRNQPSLAQRDGLPGVEVEIASSDGFPVRDSLLTLRIGSRTFAYSRYVDGDLHRVVFSLTAAEFAGVSASDNVLVHYGTQARGDVWNCGRLDGRR
jgi:hypothetical protein